MLSGSLEEATAPENVTTTVRMALLLTVVSLVPSVLAMTTCYVRFLVVLGLLRQALGAGPVALQPGAGRAVPVPDGLGHGPGLAAGVGRGGGALHRGDRRIESAGARGGGGRDGATGSRVHEPPDSIAAGNTDGVFLLLDLSDDPWPAAHGPAEWVEPTSFAEVPSQRAAAVVPAQRTEDRVHDRLPGLSCPSW